MTINLIVVGGGTAGWLSANILNRRLSGRAKVTLVESKVIGRIGVGEATVPLLKETLFNLGIDEYEFMRRTNATFKHAIRYNGWVLNPADNARDYYYHPFENFQAARKNPNQSYYGAIQYLTYATGHDVTNYWWHRKQLGRAGSFAYEIGIQPQLCDAFKSPKTLNTPPYQSDVPYAYHLDAQLFADYLQEHGVRQGIRHIVDDVTGHTPSPSGDIRSISTTQHGEIDGDFFVDCSGFAGILIEKALGVPFYDYSEHLLCDRAIALPLSSPKQNLRPYTSCTAAPAGWIWEIDLTSRTGNGYVYSSRFISDDDAEAYLRKYLGPASAESKALRLRMKVGRRTEMWRKNCVAIGLSGGFIEPLESTGIMFVDIAANWLADLFPFAGERTKFTDLYNSILASQFDEIRDFIVLHYCLSKRDDTPFWQEVRRPERIPASLQQKLDLWSETLPQPIHLSNLLQIYDYRNYECILFGMGWEPKIASGRHGIIGPPQPDQLIKAVQTSAARALADLPSHAEFLQRIATRPEPKNEPEKQTGSLSAGAIIVRSGVPGAEIRLSSGTQSGEHLPHYKPHAKIAKGPWRPATENEINVLTDVRQLKNIGSLVAIFRVDPKMLGLLTSLGRKAAKLSRFHDRPMFEGAEERFIELLVRRLGKRYSEPNSLYRSEGITVNSSGGLTTTFDLDDHQYPGLHLDNWSGLGPQQRDGAYNRMCINIGTQPRQFMFINLPLRRIIELLAPLDLAREHPTKIGRLFMTQFPHYPVVSVTLAPGEGYIAPTENLIHDGSTEGTSEPDVVLTLLGRFGFRTKPDDPTDDKVLGEAAKLAGIDSESVVLA